MQRCGRRVSGERLRDRAARRGWPRRLLGGLRLLWSALECGRGVRRSGTAPRRATAPASCGGTVSAAVRSVQPPAALPA